MAEEESAGGEKPMEDFAAEKTINEILGEETWVSVIGTVIARSPEESSVVLDDGTGQIDAKVTTMPELGCLVRIIGRAFTSDGKAVLDAAIIQDFSCFDVELYRRILELEERVFSQEEDCRQ